jgi:hypothetical protein
MHTLPLRIVLGAATGILLFSATNVTADDAQWISLFDGTSLDGWETVGK